MADVRFGPAFEGAGSAATSGHGAGGEEVGEGAGHHGAEFGAGGDGGVGQSPERSALGTGAQEIDDGLVEGLTDGVGDVGHAAGSAEFGEERLADVGLGGHHLELGVDDGGQPLPGQAGSAGCGGDGVAHGGEEIPQEKSEDVLLAGEVAVKGR